MCNRGFNKIWYWGSSLFKQILYLVGTSRTITCGTERLYRIDIVGKGELLLTYKNILQINLELIFVELNICIISNLYGKGILLSY